MNETDDNNPAAGDKVEKSFIESLDDLVTEYNDKTNVVLTQGIKEDADEAEDTSTLSQKERYNSIIPK